MRFMCRPKKRTCHFLGQSQTSAQCRPTLVIPGGFIRFTARSLCRALFPWLIKQSECAKFRKFEGTACHVYVKCSIVGKLRHWGAREKLFTSSFAQATRWTCNLFLQKLYVLPEMCNGCWLNLFSQWVHDLYFVIESLSLPFQLFLWQEVWETIENYVEMQKIFLYSMPMVLYHVIQRNMKILDFDNFLSFFEIRESHKIYSFFI